MSFYLALAIEQGIEPEYEKALIASAKLYGWQVHLVQHVPFTDTFATAYEPGMTRGPLSEALLSNPNVWFHGSIQAAKAAQRVTKWQVHAPWPSLRCAVYYSFLQKRLFQKDWMLTTVEGVKVDKDALFSSEFVEDETLFVRPDACDKLFTGMCLSLREFEEGYKRMTFYDPPPNTQVVVARPQKILAEARFLVVDKKIVTGSSYRNDGKGVHLPATPKLLEEAEEMLKFCLAQGYNPAPSWVLDLAYDGVDWLILEVGASSCSGLYKCDTDLFIEALTRMLSRDLSAP